jgi:hypothetical protein
MNLWAKHIGQLVVFAVALFFLSCQDEASLLGYKNPNTKFQVNYIEIPIESSILLLDSQRTSNFIFEGESNRLLVGQYIDDRFGSVSATGYTQFFTNTFAKLPADAIYDSITLHLHFDNYTYGSRDSTTQQGISIYELDEAIVNANRPYYFNRSEVQIKPVPLATKTFIINPRIFEDSKKGSDTINIPLDPLFGQRIFENAVRFRDGTTVADSMFVKFNEFSEVFKGLAIKSDNADKLVGFNVASAASFMTVIYHTGSDTTKRFLNLGFFPLTSFSQIESDRSGTSLAGLNQYYQDFNPAEDLRYIQSGTGIYTKLDFGKFFEFADTVPNIVINSAQLTVGSVEASVYAPPSSLALYLLKDDNQVKKLTSRKDTLDLSLYNPIDYSSHSGTIGVDGSKPIIDADLALYGLGDQANPYLAYSADSALYHGHFSLLFQQLSIQREDKTRFRYFALYPSTPGKPSNTKTVNRVIFPRDDIKLKIYYTKPTTPLN